jgi:AcrR family transcriptional regulator
MPKPSGTGEGRADSARQRIIEAALRLFYGEGIRATGIDRIIAEAKVAKMSFYHHFPSKSDLICAFLEERHRRWTAWFAGSVARHGRPGNASKLAAVADALGEWFADPGFRGCAFINTSAEFTDHEAREHAIVISHKQELEERLIALAQADGLNEPERAGRLALLIVEGAIVRAQMSSLNEAAKDARDLLEILARAHGGKPQTRKPDHAEVTISPSG